MTSQGLTVRERIEAAIGLRRHANPALPLSVSAICREAAVSRANLYAHYPDLVQAIRSTWLPRAAPAQSADKARAPLLDRAPIDKELLYLCLELRAEVEALRRRAESPLPAGRPRKR